MKTELKPALAEVDIRCMERKKKDEVIIGLIYYSSIEIGKWKRIYHTHVDIETLRTQRMTALHVYSSMRIFSIIVPPMS